MFLLEYARRQRVDGVVVADLDGALEDDRAGVEGFVDEVNGAAGDLDAVFERLSLRVESGKCGQQAWVNIDDAVGKGAYEIARQEPHIAGEANKLDIAAF